MGGTTNTTDRVVPLRAIPVLRYLSVHPRPTTPDTIDAGLFGDHLDALTSQGYVPITIRNLVTAIAIDAPVPSRAVALTFDQGLRTFYEYALPALRRRDMPSTLFVTTGYVGHESRAHTGASYDERVAMNWSQLRDLAFEDVAVGSNGHSHRPLDLMNRWEAGEELALSRSLLEHQLERPIDITAYPSGLASAATKSSAERVGYRAGCVLDGATATNRQDLFSLSRIRVHGHTRPEVLVARLAMLTQRPPRRGEPLSMKAQRTMRRLVSMGHRDGLTTSRASRGI